MVLSILVPLMLLGLGWLSYDILGTRVGADTKYGAVYKTRLHGETLYQWYVFHRDGTVWESGITNLKPYIYENDNVITCLQKCEDDGIDTYVIARNYDLDSGSISEFLEEEQPVFSRRLWLGWNSGKKVDSGSELVEIKDLTLHNTPLYDWCVYDTDKEILWYDTSEMLPEVTENNGEIILTYQEEGRVCCRAFVPEERDFSHAYYLCENDSVYVEQAMAPFDWYHLEYKDEIARTADFNNIYRTEITDLYDAYECARAEVTIPYTLVTTRVDLQAMEIICWEVTFSQKDDPDGQVQTVYLNSAGQTLLILDGRPNA